MKARRLTSSPKAKRSRKFMFSKFRFLALFRKRRVSVTRMSARQTDPSNHGTKPKPSTTGQLESSLHSTAASMPPASTTPQRSADTSSSTVSSGHAHSTASAMTDISIDDVTVDRDEIWVQQLQRTQRARYESQAQALHKEYIGELERAGPFATPERRQELERQYEERLSEITQLQRDELDYYIEAERQIRLWSMGLQDSAFEGWNGLVAGQQNIIANIKRESLRSNEDQPWEDQLEGADAFERDEAWETSEADRLVDRRRWAQRIRNTTHNMEARRERDQEEFANLEAQKRAMDDKKTRVAEVGREGAAGIRAQASQSTFFPGFDTARGPYFRSPVSESSSRSSATESIFSASPTADTAPSSVGNDRSDATRRQNASRPFPTSTLAQDGTRRSATGTFSGSSSSARVRPPSMSTQASPTPGNPTYAKNDQPVRATVWVPPAASRESGSFSQRGSEKSDGTKAPPTKKASMLFGASPEPPPPRPLADPLSRSEQPRQVPTSQTQSHTSIPHPVRATPSQTSFHVPNAPGQRPHPLPDSQPKPQPKPSSVPYNSFSSTFPESRHPSSAGASASSPVNSGTKTTSGAAKQPTSSADEYRDRAKVRTEYVRKEEERIEEERKRREEEENERRAADARRRGAEKRRKEELAREAERREAERKTRKASINNMRPVPDRPVLEVWNAYENAWTAMATATQLRFRSIPWPMLAPVSSPDMLIPIHIAAFILNPQHSQGKSRKDRLREALLRWHPDRFEAKWLKKVVEEDRASVQEGVGSVVRALNDLLSAEGTFAG